MDIHERNTIYRSIMEDDQASFVRFIEEETFNKDQRLKSELYPESSNGLSLLELCCYHGSIGCFKLLETKFNSVTTRRCLQLSFLGGNPGIINEYLKEQEPDRECMQYAIISYNIDFISFLKNEHEIDIDLNVCVQALNLQAFFIDLDMTKDFQKSFIYSPGFSLLSLVEYLISNCQDINAREIKGSAAIHFAVQSDCKEILKFLILNGAFINSQNNDGTTPLHLAVYRNNIEFVKILILHGADIKARRIDGVTPLYLAARYNCIEIAKLLFSNSADIGAKSNDGRSALHIAAGYADLDIVELLLIHGANVNEKKSCRWKYSSSLCSTL
ncbi:ankyrin repeat protein, putative [Trichomonas vaginalis G3]|uniref:Ankyrin repeat protein, putative n=1 Tax=Trichomonas vaginalis (strain ATCC PRA-98 / G3) TaxID=412133 RepID=A2E0Y0_TRIV3|nr:spectrin binding [Trichomonas vaginalis G3]EAY13735.1 ankyrin repeat protein, putative [Trichomonas vaginalis G3]KAI5529667.1 spectrin binding [Trichomonas vaginalis G3]|eukprot:XP_001325958.1 ankyrin repeat protein [Trichomonas vaginalis G3]